MNISLDFDDTYTLDPVTWNAVVRLLLKAGHKVYLVTWRNGNEMAEVLSTIGTIIGYENCIATSGYAKKEFIEQYGIKIDVWIDDNPLAIHHDVTDLSF
jgi:hypothetical protein